MLQFDIKFTKKPNFKKLFKEQAKLRSEMSTQHQALTKKIKDIFEELNEEARAIGVTMFLHSTTEETGETATHVTSYSAPDRENFLADVEFYLEEMFEKVFEEIDETEESGK